MRLESSVTRSILSSGVESAAPRKAARDTLDFAGHVVESRTPFRAMTARVVITPIRRGADSWGSVQPARFNLQKVRRRRHTFNGLKLMSPPKWGSSS